ncbi:MAG: right-handed parallel beta-helix repeat-containing protein [Kiritimatiellae bacterium]|nr:right-handed parallel beta-helix repeat-containing protein [Kiritimatiellia bacterium]
MRAGKHRVPSLMLLAAGLTGACACAQTAGVLWVAPDGAAKAPGTRAEPLSLAAAVARASRDMQVRELVLAGGEYRVEDVNFSKPDAADSAKYPPLTIRPAEPGKVTLYQSQKIDRAEPVAGLPGVFRTDRIPPGRAHLWERDARVRYVELATKDSVAAYPASCFLDAEENALYFHTSDGKAWAEHDIHFGLGLGNGRGLGVYRPNVTIEGLRFRDFIDVPALILSAPNQAVRRCAFENIDRGCLIGKTGVDAVIEDCTFDEVGQGVRSQGANTTVRRCRLVKSRGAFRYPNYPALDTGVYTYYPADSSTVSDCLIQGYHQGVRVKTGGKGRYRIRHNTILDCELGVSWVGGYENTDCSHNIIVGATDFIRVSRFPSTFALDDNLFWQPKQLLEYAVRSAVIRGANLGKRHMLADPRFVDPDNGDYRLLPDSPALALKDAEGRPAGAFGAVEQAEAARAAPRPALSLAFTADTVPFGPHGTLTFERDPWIGGGTTHVRDLPGNGGLPKRLSGRPRFTLQPRAFDPIGHIVATRITIGDGAPEESPFRPERSVTLPDADGEYRIRVEAKSERGAWSEPAEAVVRLDRKPPALAGAPVVFANAHGLIVTFRADEPCFAEVEFGPSAEYGATAKMPAFIKRNWDSLDGGDYIESWTLPRTEFAVPILAPQVEAGQRLHLRVRLRDEAGLESVGPDFDATAGGAARTLYVGTTGSDGAGHGDRTRPWRTLQYAVDRALPGDRVVLLPGTYTKPALVTHGGIDANSPLTIEAEKPGTVTLDSAGREPWLIATERAPFVTIRNLRILYYERAGVYVYRSPHVTVDACQFYKPRGVGGYHVFFFWSPYGTITRCLAIGGDVGLSFVESPHATVTRNTVSQALGGAVSYSYSLKGTVQMNNCFVFAGNDSVVGEIRHPDELKTFRSDYNNLGQYLINHNRDKPVAQTPTWDRIKAESFKFKYGTPRYPFSGLYSKGIVRIAGTQYKTMQDWREAYGQDTHSVFADPKFVKPFGPVDRWSWQLQPGSPNIGAGENGTTIGAFGEGGKDRGTVGP